MRPVSCADFFLVNAPPRDGNEPQYLTVCIDTGWISSAGPLMRRSEQAFAARMGRSTASPPGPNPGTPSNRRRQRGQSEKNMTTASSFDYDVSEKIEIFPIDLTRLQEELNHA